MGYYYYYNDKRPEENSDLEILSELLGSVENEIVEFKAASNGFDFHKLGQYFSAISNEANLNLLASLRTAGEIKTDSPNRQTSNWILNK